jgi:tetratricopeptide (TPR) repeat protein
VDKFIGDAVMAVFGIPRAHEDDALRACRAAVEMRDGLPELGLRGRIGVNSGEVVTGTAERLVTGDAVNVAARFEQAAAPGEVLIGALTHSLVRGAVVAEPVEPLELKGKAEPVPAFRLVTVLDAPERSHTSSFVGRERELALITEAWERARAQSACELVTVVGEAGVGKSRLVAEALAAVEARVVRGRCLPYGEGITYWPVVEVLKQLDAVPSDPVAAAAIRSLLGENERGTSADEIGWAFRKLLEEQAPLVCVFDDVQWGEETFLDLVEATSPLSTGAPLLLICMARPELIERRPGWPATLRLEPLAPDQADALIGDAVSGVLAERIAQAAGGNPLFITEMLEMAAEHAEVEVPPTLKALLAMRLDQLDGAERRVLECGSVEGEIFHRGAVQALAPEQTQVTTRLAALARRQLIRPDRTQLPGDDGFRFRHLLIRDTAYDALPKSVRADLHQRLADWLDQHGHQLVERDELVGYHLEQAVRYGDELGRPDPALSLRAGDRLAAAGRRALWRSDDRAAARLLTRALELRRPLRLDVNLELDLAQAFLADPQQAASVAEQAAERAAAAEDAAGEALARAVTGLYRAQLTPTSPDELEAFALKALPLLEQSGDHAGLAHVWNVLGFGVANGRSRLEDMVQASEQALRHARLAGRQSPNISFLEAALAAGPRPANEALATLERLEERPSPVSVLFRAWFLAMLGRFDEAWPLAEQSYARYGEQSDSWVGDWIMAEIATLADDHEDASRRLTNVCEWLEASGQLGFLSTYAPMLGRELCALGRYDEAAEAARLGRQAVEEHDIGAQALWRQVQARVHASRGEHAEAEPLARAAVEMLTETDALPAQARAHSDLAGILDAAGRRDEAAAALHEALECYERKQIIPLARRTREQLATLEQRSGIATARGVSPERLGTSD